MADRTHALAKCDPFCDLSKQSIRALTLGLCDWCGGSLPQEPSVARMLRAKRLCEEADRAR